jgi:hypothetical protein
MSENKPMSPQEQNMEDYNKLQPLYLAEAEEMFGPKTDYNFIGIFYHNFPPRMIHHSTDFLSGERYFKIELCGKTINDKKGGIFELSHEIVHLLSPVEQKEDEDLANYLEEGMAVYFSKLITERETGDLEFCDVAIAKDAKYLKAYELYLALIEIDKDAVKKLRDVTSVVAYIKPEDFVSAKLDVPDQLITDLLTKFS